MVFSRLHHSPNDVRRFEGNRTVVIPKDYRNPTGHTLDERNDQFLGSIIIPIMSHVTSSLNDTPNLGFITTILFEHLNEMFILIIKMLIV